MVFKELHILIFVEFLYRGIYIILHVLMGPKKKWVNGPLLPYHASPWEQYFWGLFSTSAFSYFLLYHESEGLMFVTLACHLRSWLIRPCKMSLGKQFILNSMIWVKRKTFELHWDIMIHYQQILLLLGLQHYYEYSVNSMQMRLVKLFLRDLSYQLM
jgi:hypothetical protein